MLAQETESRQNKNGEQDKEFYMRPQITYMFVYEIHGSTAILALDIDSSCSSPSNSSVTDNSIGTTEMLTMCVFTYIPNKVDRRSHDDKDSIQSSTIAL